MSSAVTQPITGFDQHDPCVIGIWDQFDSVWPSLQGYLTFCEI